MSVDRAEVRKFLNNWANTKSKPHFAVLIEGPWGCGKTHFVLKLLEDERFTSRRSIYLSVFGIADIKSLETSLFYASASTLTKTLHKGAGLAGSIFSGALTLGSGGIFGGTASLNKVLEAAASQLEQSAKNLDGALLVLDDLERCQIPMSELLGVVNRFVEHGDTRVILMANTDDLRDEHFSAFREKVVGHSFLLASDQDGALNSFIDELEKAAVRGILEHYRSCIQELYDNSGYQNLRALRQFVWQLAIILERMDERYRQNDKLVRNLIVQLFIFFIEFKLDLSDDTALLRPADLLGKHDQGKDEARHVYEFSFDKEKEPSPKRRIFDKYKQGNGIRTVITVQQWISILTSGVIDENRLNAELAQSDEVAGVGSWPSWKRLWHFHEWDFSDGSEQEFWLDVEDMQSKLVEGSYINVGEFLHVVGVSLMLAGHQLIDKTLPDTVTEMKAYIDDKFIPSLTSEHCRRVTERSYHFFESYDGLGFIGRDRPEFREVTNYLAQKIQAWRQDWLSGDAGKELLGLLMEDRLQFLGNLKVINYPSEQRYLDIPILATIDAEAFVDTLFKLARHDEQFVVGSLKDRYERCPALLDAEGLWWRSVQEELMRRADSLKSRPRKVQIRSLVSHINSSIIEMWELRQFQDFSNGNLADLGWMTRRRVGDQ